MGSSSEVLSGRVIGQNPETKIEAGGASYIFKESDRKIQDAVDNEKIEERMKIYAQRNENGGNTETGEAGNSKG